MVGMLGKKGILTDRQFEFRTGMSCITTSLAFN